MSVVATWDPSLQLKAVNSCFSFSIWGLSLLQSRGQCDCHRLSSHAPTSAEKEALKVCLALAGKKSPSCFFYAVAWA